MTQDTNEQPAEPTVAVSDIVAAILHDEPLYKYAAAGSATVENVADGLKGWPPFAAHMIVAAHGLAMMAMSLETEGGLGHDEIREAFARLGELVLEDLESGERRKADELVILDDQTLDAGQRTDKINALYSGHVEKVGAFAEAVSAMFEPWLAELAGARPDVEGARPSSPELAGADKPDESAP